MRTKTVLIVLAFCCFQMALTSQLFLKQSKQIIDKIGESLTSDKGTAQNSRAYVTNIEVVRNASNDPME